MPDIIGARPTAAGLELLNKVLARGVALTFTRGAFGDCLKNGQYVVPTADQQIALTALINEKMSLPITSYSYDAGEATVDLLVRNAGVTQAFQVREVGLFAQDPDNQQEVLFAYTYWGDYGSIMPAAVNNVIIEFFYRYTTSIGAAENVTVVVDTAANLYTSLIAFNTHVNSANPHPNAPQYTLPTASANVKGGVKIGANLSMDGDTLNASAAQYTLPTASANVKGGVKIGANLSMDGDTLNASAAQYTLPTASAVTLGGVKVSGDDGVLIDNGFLKLDSSKLPPAGLEERVLALERAVFGEMIADTVTPSDTSAWQGSSSTSTSTLDPPSISGGMGRYSTYGNTDTTISSDGKTITIP